MDASNRNDCKLQLGDALLIVDVQNDFLPGGSLAVPHADEIVPVLNRYISMFFRLPVFVTRDWHPEHHISFVGHGGPWPPHCIANTHGAAFPVSLHLPSSAVVIAKATRPDRDAYSGFDGTELDARLRAANVRRLFVAGLATDYCVRATVLDAMELGYRVILLTDAMRAVDVRAGDGERALEEMTNHGVQSFTEEGVCP